MHPTPTSPKPETTTTLDLKAAFAWSAEAARLARMAHAATKLRPEATQAAVTLRNALIMLEAAQEELLLVKDTSPKPERPEKEKKTMQARTTDQETTKQQKKEIKTAKAQKPKATKPAAAAAANGVTNKTPTKLWIGKKSWVVTSWADLLRCVCEYLLEEEPAKFKRAFTDEAFQGRLKRLVGKDKAQLRQPFAMAGGFIELNLSASAKLAFAKKLVAFVGIDPGTMDVNYQL